MNNEVRYLIRLAAFAVVILVLFCTLSPTGFLSTANLSSMAYQLPEFAMLALAIHPTMLTGGIDLSVVSVANLSAIVAALTMRSLCCVISQRYADPLICRSCQQHRRGLCPQEGRLSRRPNWSSSLVTSSP